MAWSLDDVLRRRLPLSLIVRLDRLQIRQLAELLAPELRRDPTELIEEYARDCG
jgi:hypothetical protein